LPGKLCTTELHHQPSIYFYILSKVLFKCCDIQKESRGLFLKGKSGTRREVTYVIYQLLWSDSKMLLKRSCVKVLVPRAAVLGSGAFGDDWIMRALTSKTDYSIDGFIA
jgi:hypothetical protein